MDIVNGWSEAYWWLCKCVYSLHNLRLFVWPTHGAAISHLLLTIIISLCWRRTTTQKLMTSRCLAISGSSSDTTEGVTLAIIDRRFCHALKVTARPGWSLHLVSILAGFNSRFYITFCWTALDTLSDMFGTNFYRFLLTLFCFPHFYRLSSLVLLFSCGVVRTIVVGEGIYAGLVVNNDKNRDRLFQCFSSTRLVVWRVVLLQTTKTSKLW